MIAGDNALSSLVNANAGIDSRLTVTKEYRKLL
jgi:hypothetical protein